VGIILMVLSKSLAFELRSTKRVIKEIRTDMGSNAQMNRFTGDVGSGKTPGLMSAASTR
jgi:RecG-like helicase